MIDPDELSIIHRALRPPARRLLLMEQRAGFELGALMAERAVAAQDGAR